MKQKYFYILSFLTVLFILTSYKSGNELNNLIRVPRQTLDLYKIIGYPYKTSTETINAFEISSFVTYGEYKVYLKEVEKDSSQQFYLTQLPDTQIAPKEIYEKYISSSDYDDYPVLGISWDNAMNFCKWKTLTDNSKDSITFIYRLPNCSEWLAAYNYLKEQNMENDFDKNYSDWLLNQKFTNFLDQGKFIYDCVYLHKKDDPLVMKQKMVIGDSYAFQKSYLADYYWFSYYATEGYRQVSFRYMKANKKDSESILEYWGLNTK